MEVSTKPYLIRAIVDWCTDAGFTPYVAVAVDDSVRVPQEFVKNGEIVLNVSALATHRLQIRNEAVEFQARFGGVAREVYVPIARVIAVYARENGQGMAFEVPRALQHGGEAAPTAKPRTESVLRAVEAPKATMSLVPVAPVSSPTTPSSNDVNEAAAAPATDLSPEKTPPSPGNGDRPRLTRIK
jgi:stringent starvation protein B